MPQLLIVALLGAGLYAGYRWYARAAKELAADIKRSQDDVMRTAGLKDMGRLEYDPATGVYRPVDRG